MRVLIEELQKELSHTPKLLDNCVNEEQRLILQGETRAYLKLKSRFESLLEQDQDQMASYLAGVHQRMKGTSTDGI